MFSRSLNNSLVSDTPMNRSQLLRVLRSRQASGYQLELKVMLIGGRYVI